MEKQDSAFWEFIINAAVVVAAFALYSKTAEVMVALAPVTLFGQTGLSLIYGMTVAGLVEFVTLALHFLNAFEGNQRAEGYKWFLFMISTFCQFLDQSLVKDVANRSDIEAFFAWLALGIVPAIFFGLLWVKGGSQTVQRKRQRFKGLRPMWDELINGTNGVLPEPQVFGKDLDQAEDAGHKAKYTPREER